MAEGPCPNHPQPGPLELLHAIPFLFPSNQNLRSLTKGKGSAALEGEARTELVAQEVSQQLALPCWGGTSSEGHAENPRH